MGLVLHGLRRRGIKLFSLDITQWTFHWTVSLLLLLWSPLIHISNFFIPNARIKIRLCVLSPGNLAKFIQSKDRKSDEKGMADRKFDKRSDSSSAVATGCIFVPYLFVSLQVECPSTVALESSGENSCLGSEVEIPRRSFHPSFLSLYIICPRFFVLIIAGSRICKNCFKNGERGSQ